MLRCWFLPIDQEAKVLGDSPALVESLDRLKRLHYFLLGVKVEKLPWWGPEFREVALAARDHTAFASIVLQPFGAPASVYLYTPLRGGGMVFTRDYAGGAQVEDEWLSVRNVPTEDLERLAGAHHDRVEDMRRRGRELEVRATQAGRQQATYILLRLPLLPQDQHSFPPPASAEFLRFDRAAPVGGLYSIRRLDGTQRSGTRRDVT